MPELICPICDRPTVPAYTPFCSRRCADVDLGRWLTGGYAFPASEEAPDDDDGTNDGAADPARSRTRSGDQAE